MSQARSSRALRLGLSQDLQKKHTLHVPALSFRILWFCCFLSASNSLRFIKRGIRRESLSMNRRPNF